MVCHQSFIKVSILSLCCFFSALYFSCHIMFCFVSVRDKSASGLLPYNVLCLSEISQRQFSCHITFCFVSVRDKSASVLLPYNVLCLSEISQRQYGTDKFTAVEVDRTVTKDGVEEKTGDKCSHQCITAMEEYSCKSLEVCFIMIFNFIWVKSFCRGGSFWQLHYLSVIGSFAVVILHIALGYCIRASVTLFDACHIS